MIVGRERMQNGHWKSPYSTIVTSRVALPRIGAPSTEMIFIASAGARGFGSRGCAAGLAFSRSASFVSMAASAAERELLVDVWRSPTK